MENRELNRGERREIYKLVTTICTNYDRHYDCCMFLDDYDCYMPQGGLRNLSAAAAFADEIEQIYEKLSDNLYMYEHARDSRLKAQGYRRIPIKNYVMLYLVDDDKREVIVARVFYGKQEYTKLI